MPKRKSSNLSKSKRKSSKSKRKSSNLSKSKRKSFKSKRKSLYTRLGGVYSIAGVIDHFSDSLIDNPIVGKNSKNPMLRDWHRNKLARLPGLKFMRTLWVCSISGGSYKFVPTVPGKCPFGLENAHKKFKISPKEFDAVADELSKSLDYFNVPEKEKQEVLNVFSKHKSEVDRGYFLANKMSVKHITCPFLKQ